jgi:hypothetical protein
VVLAFVVSEDVAFAIRRADLEVFGIWGIPTILDRFNLVNAFEVVDVGINPECLGSFIGSVA